MQTVVDVALPKSAAAMLAAGSRGASSGVVEVGVSDRAKKSSAVSTLAPCVEYLNVEARVGVGEATVPPVLDVLRVLQRSLESVLLHVRLVRSDISVTATVKDSNVETLDLGDSLLNLLDRCHTVSFSYLSWRRRVRHLG